MSVMSEQNIANGFFINSIVGEGTRFDGNITLQGILRIDGDYAGDIKTEGKVLIGKNGRAACAIEAATVVVGGAMKGDILASEKVVVLSTAIFIGNVTAPRIVLEEGVIFHGTCRVAKVVPAEFDGSKELKTPENKLQKSIDQYNPALNSSALKNKSAPASNTVQASAGTCPESTGHAGPDSGKREPLYGPGPHRETARVNGPTGRYGGETLSPVSRIMGSWNG